MVGVSDRSDNCLSRIDGIRTANTTLMHVRYTYLVWLLKEALHKTLTQTSVSTGDDRDGLRHSVLGGVLDEEGREV